MWPMGGYTPEIGDRGDGGRGDGGRARQHSVPDQRLHSEEQNAIAPTAGDVRAAQGVHDGGRACSTGRMGPRLVAHGRSIVRPMGEALSADAAPPRSGRFQWASGGRAGPPAGRAISGPGHQRAGPPAGRAISGPDHQRAGPSAGCPTVYLSSVCLYVSQSVCLSVCLSVSQSVWLSV